MSGPRTGPGARWLLAPLVPVYAAAVGVNALAYAHGWRRPRRLRWPVVSIGNLSVGGAGKTPVVIALAKLLREQGIAVDVLSRGYGRMPLAAAERVVPGGDARRFGDEPPLIAEAAQVPVFVGASRYAAGLLAEASGISGEQAGLHLLDDGFQHRQLARTVDIVVVHPGDLGERLLPLGRLREPVRALRRASILVLREDDASSEGVLRRRGYRQPVWRVRRVLDVSPVGGEAIAFCGIAHPGEFFAGLRRAGVALRGTLAFRDHHRYSREDLLRIVDRATGAAALLTTEKDLVRLDAGARALLGRGARLVPVPLRAELLAPATSLGTLLALLGQPVGAADPVRE